ncbi:thiazole biosynthesis adenylyltransferase ThiF [Ectobacillus ponti]|uniref:Thiazole biosynthesis adenylyltransferase ThiF n=1 Tax=Ectobacillus ponti TaxID=2961894 RepID=A0AA41X790_9BACI|nr:thiazole biosynthesis adenylyltransferase ThiF [Ectobacillus ponti]MCP8968135.1 thiazole biosynthesis adenylyltransferase ThiF [Ectobacillus ponti]
MNRYSRQVLFKPIGEAGQSALQEKHALIIGAGALGSGNAEMLVRAGVGRVTIVDRDYVDWSNLQRQQLYAELDAAGQLPKAAAAKRRLQAINSEVEIVIHVADATAELLERLAADADVIIDATDNFETRFIINDVAQKLGVPWIYGACVGSYGISYTILPGETPCLSCLLQTIPLGGATCDTAGIISPAVSMTVSHQVAEALKLLSGNREALRRELVSFDVWSNEYSAVRVQAMKKESCPSCGPDAVHPYLQRENTSQAAVLCGRDTVQIRLPQAVPIEEYRRNLPPHAEHIVQNPYLLSFSLDGKRFVLFRDGRLLLHGTKDITEARTIYHRYFG